jgi:cytidylate kinase
MNYDHLSFNVARALLESASTPPQPTETPLSAAARPFTIAISRQAGALGTTVANAMGQRLGWPVYDQNIVEQIAEKIKKPTFYLREIDERPVTWMEDSLSWFFTKYHASRTAYMKYLVGAVRGLGEIGRCVIVGRAAPFILPPESTMRVRLVAPLADRTKVIAAQRGLSDKEAAHWVAKTDRDREEFVRAHVGLEPTDPAHYDLVLNTGRLSVEECVRIVEEALHTMESRQAAAKQQPARIPVAL